MTSERSGPASIRHCPRSLAASSRAKPIAVKTRRPHTLSVATRYGEKCLQRCTCIYSTHITAFCSPCRIHGILVRLGPEFGTHHERSDHERKVSRVTAKPAGMTARGEQQPYLYHRYSRCSLKSVMANMKAKHDDRLRPGRQRKLNGSCPPVEAESRTPTHDRRGIPL